MSSHQTGTEAPIRIRLRRVYAPPEADDGMRVLVDRIWPRGVSKERARVDLWLRDVAPSDDLRRWFGHDPARWEEFQARYRQELEDDPVRLAPLFEAVRRGPVTLLYSARDEHHNQAVALKAIVEERLRSEQETRRVLESRHRGR
ncbi:MAG: hypothetical protein KatS3mg059_0450 [Thermomicrobiales bacterium]|nr:MAG: hypothetical protein KatS3mg059_0450 [Thermomicrobiales bacterium]